MSLRDGSIVHTQSRLREFNESHKSNNPNALTLPLVLLIDGETASSAEVLAGALKENGRAILVGQPTFGKGSIQYVLPLDKAPLDKMPAGIRVTVPRFLSPLKHPYSGRRIAPDVPVHQERDPT